MAIRRRLHKPILKGIPAPEFQGYVRRFGHVYAEFDNAAMLSLMGRAPDYRPRPDEPRIIEFYTEVGLANWINDRRDKNIPVEALRVILAGWPTGTAAQKLRSFCFQSAA